MSELLDVAVDVLDGIEAAARAKRCSECRRKFDHKLDCSRRRSSRKEE